MSIPTPLLRFYKINSMQEFCFNLKDMKFIGSNKNSKLRTYSDRHGSCFQVIQTPVGKTDKQANAKGGRGKCEWNYIQTPAEAQERSLGAALDEMMPVRGGATRVGLDIYGCQRCIEI
jgi:hypothetical protein